MAVKCICSYLSDIFLLFALVFDQILFGCYEILLDWLFFLQPIFLQKLQTDFLHPLKYSQKDPFLSLPNLSVLFSLFFQFQQSFKSRNQRLNFLKTDEFPYSDPCLSMRYIVVIPIRDNTNSLLPFFSNTIVIHYSKSCVDA